MKDDDVQLIKSETRTWDATSDLPEMEITIAVSEEDLPKVEAELAACNSAEEVAMLLADLSRRFKVVRSKGVSKEVH